MASAAALLQVPVTAQDATGETATSNEGRPNLLLIVTDDQRPETMVVMPSTKANFDVGIVNAVVTTPNCCPSRASILSGRYAHAHGVLNNWGRERFVDDEPESLAPWLQEAGYYTGFVGKYLNGYRATEPVPPGWDEFYALAWGEDGRVLGNGDVYTSFGLREKESGLTPTDTVTMYPNDTYPEAYSTTVYGDLATRFIDRAHDVAFNPTAKPWALVVFPNAPNRPYTVEPRYQDHPVPTWRKRPSFREADMADKPPQVVTSPMRMLTYGRSFGSIRRLQMRTLMSVDDMVERTFTTIDGHGDREKTWGIFASDNGVSWGEHYLGQKLHAFEEPIRVPFRMAVPGAGGRLVKDSLVANIDIAPTLLDVAGIAPSDSIHGTSLKAVALGQDGACLCRRDVVIENWRTRLTYTALRTHRWTYVAWPEGDKELYDLAHDPYQLNNVAGSRPRVVRILHRRMRAELAR